MNITYIDYKRKNDIHGTVLYPAPMVAPVQKSILSALARQNDIKSVFDPFHGSGTALYEASEVFPDALLVGCDINPLANLITDVKLKGVDTNIQEDINLLEKFIYNDSGVPVYTFINSQKWFREDIAVELTKIRNSIIRIENEKNRKFFWCMLCDIVRKYSNSRSSTYKLHTKTAEKIELMENNVIKDYLSSVCVNVSKYRRSTDNYRLYKRDAIQALKSFPNSYFDVCVTSPPYGDNATTVPYGQFSMPSLLWIDSKDLALEGWELDSYSTIDSKSLGGYKKDQCLSENKKKYINTYLSKISKQKQTKVIRFFSDYFKILDELCRVTNQYIVITLGNRRVDNIKINLTRITIRYIEQYGFVKEKKLVRNILNKRTPALTSKVSEHPVQSMSKEYTVICRRN